MSLVFKGTPEFESIKMNQQTEIPYLLLIRLNIKGNITKKKIVILQKTIFFSIGFPYIYSIRLCKLI